MAYIPASNNFANAFNLTLHQSMAQAEREAERRRQEESWNKYADTFQTQQPTDVVQVQTPTAPIPGQSGITTQPSEATIAPPTQATNVQLPSKDPYKILQYETGKQFAEQIKSLAGMNPQERQMAMRQLWGQREQVLSDARYNKFSTELDTLLSNMNPNDPVSLHTSRAKALKLGRDAGIDPSTVLKMFEQPKQNLHVVGKSLVRDDGTVIYQDPYAPRGGGGGGRIGGGVDKPVNPNTHDVNTGVRLGAPELWAKTYELNDRIKDQELLDDYESRLDSTKKEDVEWMKKNRVKVNTAMERMNQYWRISSGGGYGATGGGTTTAQPPASPVSNPAPGKSLDQIFGR